MTTQNSTPSPTVRVETRFSSLDEVVQRLELLHRNGYTSIGKWNLAQVCEHLRDWMLFMLDGYPKPPVWMSPMIWAMRVSVGKSMLRKIIRTGKMSAGGPTMSQTVHPPQGLDDAQSVMRLKEAIARFKVHSGAFHPSPLFGPLSTETGLALQLVHCAHHLGFLSPKS